MLDINEIIKKVKENKKFLPVAAVVLVVGYIASKNDEVENQIPVKDYRVETADADIEKEYKELEIKASDVSYRQELLNIKKEQKKLLEKIENLKLGKEGREQNQRTSDKLDNIFKTKNEQTLGYSFVNSKGFFIKTSPEGLIKEVYKEGMEKENTAQTQDLYAITTTSQGNSIVKQEETFQLFSKNTTVYYLLDGDELYIENDGESVYLITLEGKKEEYYENKEDIIKKYTKNYLKKVDYRSGDYLIVNSSNEIVENGVFEKYFFRGKTYRPESITEDQKRREKFIVREFLETGNFIQVEKVFDESGDVYEIKNKNELHMNNKRFLNNITKLFFEQNTQKIVVEENDKNYLTNSNVRMLHLFKYLGQDGTFYQKVGTKVERQDPNGVQETLGEGNIVMLKNGITKIELISNTTEELVFSDKFKDKVKIFKCKNGYSLLQNKMDIFEYDPLKRLIKKHQSSKVEVIDKKVYLNGRNYCDLDKIEIKGLGIIDKDGNFIDIKKSLANQKFVVDKFGNKYFEKDGKIYKINPDGTIELVGEGKILPDGKIMLADGTVIDTKPMVNTRIVGDEFGNQYFEKDGIIYRINPDGTIEAIGPGKILPNGMIQMDDGTIINTKDSTPRNLVEDEFGNQYFEKDGKIYRINPDGSIDMIGEGYIGEDGKVYMADGTVIDTKKVQNQQFVEDEDGNRYFEKDGIIYKINPDGTIEAIGPGRIGKDGKIYMDDGSVLNTKFVQDSMVEDEFGNQYFEKDGKIYRVRPDGTVELVGEGYIGPDGKIYMADGTIIDTKPVENNYVVDEDGNRYFEKDGKIYRINPDGSITLIGEGRINDDGTITLADGTVLNTKWETPKIVTDEFGNQYFEKDGKIYKINPDGTIELLGEGRINADGTITLTDGRIFSTKPLFEDSFDIIKRDANGNIIKDYKDVQYRYENGKLVVFKYLLNKEPILGTDLATKTMYKDISGNLFFIDKEEIIKTSVNNKEELEILKGKSSNTYNESLYIYEEDGKSQIYSGTILDSQLSKERVYTFKGNRKVKMLSEDVRIFTEEGQKPASLTSDEYSIELNKEEYWMTITKTLDYENLEGGTISGNGNIDVVYDPELNKIIYSKDGRVIKEEDNTDLFTFKRDKKIMGLKDPVRISKFFRVLGNAGETFEYIEGELVRFKDATGKLSEIEANLFFTSDKSQIILKTKNETRFFNVESIIVKPGAIVKTTTKTIAVDLENKISEYIGDNKYLLLSEQQRVVIKNNKVVIKGPVDIDGGYLVEVIGLLNQQLNYVLKKPSKDTIKLEPVKTGIDEKIIEERLARLKKELEEKMSKIKVVQPVIQKQQDNYGNLDDLGYLELQKLFSTQTSGKKGSKQADPLLMAQGSVLLSRLDEKSLTKLEEEQAAAEKYEEQESKMIIPIGTKLTAKIYSTYEVPALSQVIKDEKELDSNENLTVRFTAKDVSRLVTPRGEEIRFPKDTTLVGLMTGNRPSERVMLWIESINWYDADEDVYKVIDVNRKALTFSKAEGVQGIPALFVNKKMDGVIMSAGLEVVKGVTDAIVASQNPMGDMMNPDLGALTGGASTPTDESNTIKASAVGGASSGFEEIITMIKDDMNALIPFLVTKEKEEIEIEFTSDLVIDIRSSK